MKTARVTFLAAPEFKSFLSAEAEREGVSVAELIRRRCEQRAGDDEVALALLAAELRKAVAEARRSLRDGLAAAHGVLRQATGEAVRTPPRRRLAGARA
jgi:hypothetical protein